MRRKRYLYNFTPWRFLLGQAIVGNLARALSRLRVYGRENVPLRGGVVIAMNHFSWLDPPAFGGGCPRRMYFIAKQEIDRVAVLGPIIRFFGAFPVRRGEGDREAIRMMREVVEAGEALGVFVEGTRQRSGVPGPGLPGAAMAAIRGRVPVVPAAIRGSYEWRLGNFHPVSVAFGRPMDFSHLPPNGKGYKEASEAIDAEIRRLWEWLGELHTQGRPREAIVPVS